MTGVPSELNWVEKRAACSAAQAFNELRKGIKEDVALINSIKKLPSEQEFVVEMGNNGFALCVAHRGPAVGPTVDINLVGSRITVGDVKSTEWCVEAKLNSEGRCILRLGDGTELEQWQFRKKALEGLFFGD
jgi:hypothetical protein